MKTITAAQANEIKLQNTPDDLSYIMESISNSAKVGCINTSVYHPLSIKTKETLIRLGYEIIDVSIETNLLTGVYHVIQW